MVKQFHQEEEHDLMYVAAYGSRVGPLWRPPETQELGVHKKGLEKKKVCQSVSF